MKRLYIIDSNDEDLYYNFIKNINDKIPNIRTLNYYRDVLYNELNILIDQPYIVNYKSLHFKLNNLELLWNQLNKKSLIQKVLNLINNADTPRSIIFILIKDRILIHHIRKNFKNINTQVVKIENLTNTLDLYKRNPITKYDKIIKVIENNENLLEIVTKNFITDIPIKWFINNK